MNPRFLLLVPVLLIPLAFRSPAPAPAPAAPAAEGAWKIDPGHSTVMFKIKHLGTSWTYGRFDTFTGEVTFDEAKPENCKVLCEIDSASVDTNSKKRDSDISGPDFLSVKEFPKLSFASTKVAKSGDKYAITGDLTLHGVKKSVSFTAEKVGSSTMMGARTGFFAETTIKRSDFGMKTMLEGIGDDVQLTLSIETTH